MGVGLDYFVTPRRAYGLRFGVCLIAIGGLRLVALLVSSTDSVWSFSLSVSGTFLCSLDASYSATSGFSSLAFTSFEGSVLTSAAGF